MPGWPLRNSEVKPVRNGDCRKHEENVAVAWERQSFCDAKPMLDHRREQQHRWREHEDQPESAPVVGDHRAVVMPAVARMLGMAGAGSSYDTAMSFIVSIPGRMRLMVLVGMW